MSKYIPNINIYPSTSATIAAPSVVPTTSACPTAEKMRGSTLAAVAFVASSAHAFTPYTPTAGWTYFMEAAHVGPPVATQWPVSLPGLRASALISLLFPWELHRNAPLSPMKEGARVHHSYGSYAPSTYGSYGPREANPSTLNTARRAGG